MSERPPQFDSNLDELTYVWKHSVRPVRGALLIVIAGLVQFGLDFSSASQGEEAGTWFWILTLVMLAGAALWVYDYFSAKKRAAASGEAGVENADDPKR